jgi:hypothetical protein
MQPPSLYRGAALSSRQGRQRLIITEARRLPMSNATGVIMHGLGPPTMIATGVITDGKGLLMATPIGLTTGTPGIGVRSQGPFPFSILTSEPSAVSVRLGR